MTVRRANSRIAQRRARAVSSSLGKDDDSDRQVAVPRRAATAATAPTLCRPRHIAGGGLCARTGSGSGLSHRLSLPANSDIPMSTRSIVGGRRTVQRDRRQRGDHLAGRSTSETSTARSSAAVFSGALHVPGRRHQADAQDPGESLPRSARAGMRSWTRERGVAIVRGGDVSHESNPTHRWQRLRPSTGIHPCT